MDFKKGKMDKPLNALVWGFDSISEALNNADFIDIKFWIGKHKYVDINAHDIYHCNIPVKGFTNDSYKCFDYVYCNSFREFLHMCARHRLNNRKSIYDYYDLFVIYFNYFYSIIMEKGIEVILISCVPHVGSDYLLYLIGKYLRKRVIIFYQSILPNRFFYTEKFEDFGNFDKYLKRFDNEGILLKPDYKPDLPYMKGSGKRKGKTEFTLANFFERAFRKICENKRKNEYKKKMGEVEQKAIDFRKPFIYFPLQLNPELTTTSLGGDFFDQVLAIERLSCILPEGWKIYVKENPKQTYFMRGEFFFRRLQSLSDVVFVSKTMCTYDLINKSRIVATVTGTAGWEAITSGKNVIVFGNAWYKNFPGAHRFSDEMSLDSIASNDINLMKVRDKLNDMISKMGKGVIDPVYKDIVDKYSDKSNARNIISFLNELLYEQCH